MIETWRAAYRMMQELGIKFEVLLLSADNVWVTDEMEFVYEQNRYRIVPDQIAPTNWCGIYRAAQALGVKFDYKTMEKEQWVEVGHSEPFMVLCFHRYRLHIDIEEPKEAESSAEKKVDVTSGRTEMTFEPQCTEQWQLFAEYSRVLKMCKEAGFDKAWECVKQWRIVFGEPPELNTDPKSYEFALAIVEGRPVFRGDVLYELKGVGGVKFTATDATNISIWARNGTNRYLFMPEDLSWNPPKRTIEINGVKVKAPVEVIRHEHNTGKIVWLYSNSADAEDARAAIIAALEGKR